MTSQRLICKDACKGHYRVIRKLPAIHPGELLAEILDEIHVSARADMESRDRAWAALLERLRSQPVVDAGPWRRDHLYEHKGDQGAGTCRAGNGLPT